MKKTKILFFLAGLHGGGAQRVAMTILRKLDKKRFDITLVLVIKSGDYVDMIPKNINVIDLNLKKTIFSHFKIRKIIQELQPNIVFSTLFRTHNIIYLSLLGIKKKPLVVLRSQNSPKLVLENNQLGILAKFLLEKAYNNADMIVAQTPEMKSEIIKYHNIDGNKIEVFLNPIDTELIEKKINEIENPFDNNRINIVAAGRLTWQKGFDILVQSFKYIIDKDNNYFLHIIGNDDGEKENIQQMIYDLSLENNIKLWGFQKNPYKFFYYADLFVLSSRWEGLPNAVLENLYLKKPVVVTKCIPFMEQLVKENKNGKLVDVEDPIQLAHAILDYKSIELNFSNTFNDRDINDLFLSIGTRVTYDSVSL
ncbi:MAG: hypothetical protein COB07_11655 [Sulfurovum sp.]|nr:MAG: hypothetical protein COB07_11655 [Sulfurovum sp.]